MPLLKAVRLRLQGPSRQVGRKGTSVCIAKPSSQGKSEANRCHQNLDNRLVHVPSGTEEKMHASELGFGHSRGLAGQKAWSAQRDLWP